MNPSAPSLAQRRRAACAGTGQRPRRHALAAPFAALALALALATLAGCGGGSDPAVAEGTATVAATQFTEGTLNGFGSIIVNGVRFDETSATVTDDDGQLRQASALKLGMRVAVDSDRPDAAGTARARAVRFGSEVVGPVSAVSTATGTLEVLGQTIDITTSTVFDDSLAGGLTAVAMGAVVAVHGLPDAATGRLVATRIDSAAAATRYTLRGTVAGLDATAKTLRIGAASIAYAAATHVPATLADGQVVRVLLATAPVAGVWQAQSLGSGARGKLVDRTAVHLRGKITAFTSASSFTVHGMAVDASGATFPDGSAGLALGAEVEVQGAVSNGVLVASQVSLESRHRHDDNRLIDLRGSITSMDATAKTFVVRGVTVSYAGTVTFENGTVDQLVMGARVRVTGGVGSTRTQVVATRIRFEG
jgi:Domain of unknown function (DUF5666)